MYIYIIYKYYNVLKYIFWKEIEKVKDINYHKTIVKLLIEEKDLIKKSNGFFQKLIVKGDQFDLINFKSNILKGESNDIIKYLNDNLKPENERNEKKEIYSALKETLIYFFEKNSLIYLENKSLEEEEPLNFFIDCNQYLDGEIKEDKKLYIIKLLCIAYIKVY